MGTVTMSRLVDEIVEYQFEFKRFWLIVKSQSNCYRSFVSSRIDTHPNVEEEILFVPSDLNPSDCLTKPISMEKHGE